jgi:hypothetical protein
MLLVTGSVSASAHAQHALHWVRARGAERCIDPKALAERVEALTGSAFVPPAQAEISLEGEISVTGHGFRVRLVSTHADGVPRGERVLTSHRSDCRLFDAAIAFVIALTIDPGLSLRGVPTDLLAQFAQELPPEQTLLAELAAQQTAARSPAHDAEQTPPAQPTTPTSPKRAPAPARSARYALGLAAATLGRTLPGWPFGVRAIFSYDHARLWPLVLNAGVFPVAKQKLEGGQQVTFQSYDAALSLCPGLERSRFGAQGCLGIALSYMRAHGSGFDDNYTVGLWDPSLALGVALALRLGRGWGFAADAAMRVRFSDRGFEVRAPGGPTAIHTPDRVGLLFSLGPRYEF